MANQGPVPADASGGLGHDADPCTSGGNDLRFAREAVALQDLHRKQERPGGRDMGTEGRPYSS